MYKAKMSGQNIYTNVPLYIVVSRVIYICDLVESRFISDIYNKLLTHSHSARGVMVDNRISHTYIHLPHAIAARAKFFFPLYT